MGCKAKELFPFRGGWASAYAISKAYGVLHRTHLVQKRLRMGMPAEEAVKIRRDGPRSEIQGGIMPWEIDEMREQIHISDKIRIMVDAASGGEESTIHRRETCRVVGVYRRLVVLVRPCGLRVSRTYVDLIMEGCK